MLFYDTSSLPTLKCTLKKGTLKCAPYGLSVLEGVSTSFEKKITRTTTRTTRTTTTFKLLDCDARSEKRRFTRCFSAFRKSIFEETFCGRVPEKCREI